MKIFATIIFIFILFGCTSEDPGPIEENIIPEELSVVSEVGFDVQIADINTSSKQVIITDHSEQFADARGRKYLDYTEEYITYVYYEFPRIELWRKNLSTDEKLSGVIHEISTNQYVFDAISDDDFAYLLVDEFIDQDRVKRSVVITDLKDMSNRTQVHLTNTFNNQFGSNYLKSTDEGLLVYTTNHNNNVSLYKINTAEGTKTDSISFEGYPIIFLDKEMICEITMENRVSKYLLSDFSRVSNGNFDFNNLNARSGFFENRIENDRMVTYFSFAQPFPITSAPIEVSIENGQILTEDLFYLVDLYEAFEQERGFNISITTFEIDIPNRVVIIGYVGQQSISLGDVGGVIFANFDGELLDFIELPMIPTDIILTK